MTKLRAPFFLFLLVVSLVRATAQTNEPSALEIQAPEAVEFDPNTGIGTATNGVVVKYGDSLLTAKSASINQNTGDIIAEGDVRVQRDNQTWVGERLHYNFLTRDIEGGKFRTGRSPIFAAGEGLQSNATNHISTATNAFVTADDYYEPLLKVRAKELKIVPGKYFEAKHAMLYVGSVPVFYFPYYRRSLEPHAPHFTFLPGYRTAYGPFLLSSYNWYWNERLEGAVHADWRQERGFGGGPDFAYHFGPYGEGMLKYYYTHDDKPGYKDVNVPPGSIPENRQRLYFSYDAVARTNLTVKAQVAYWSDPLITHDFFEGEYRRDIQPKTFFEANQLWQNWSLDAYAQPRVNDFFETVERLPDVKLTGFRQQIFGTPLFYESESSAGWFKREFAETNLTALPYSAARVDTWHQITLPETFFGWLNVTPRAGGRLTYYSEAQGPGAITTEETRGVFNTGVEVSTRASQTWPGVRNKLFDVSGIRHIIEPSVDYVYVPRPNVRPSQIPQFDYFLTNSLYLPPIEFPDFNSIDSIDSQNVIRYGLRNRLQTKRKGPDGAEFVDDLVNWSVYMDWRLKPEDGQTTFSDIFSDLQLRPRTWLTLNSQTRYDIHDGVFNLSISRLTFQPNDTWSWGLGHYYLRGGTLFGPGNNLFTSTFYYRFNENWGTRLEHHFEAQTGTLQEQYYTIYRDLRSWTAALTFRVRKNIGAPTDYTAAVTFSFKAFPRFGLGRDTVTPSSLVGY